MIENPISSTSLYNQCSTLNYTQAAMMGLTGSSLQDSQQLGYSSHGNIPNIILTGSHTYTAVCVSVVLSCLVVAGNIKGKLLLLCSQGSFHWVVEVPHIIGTFLFYVR